MQIQMLEPQWNSPEAKEMAEIYRREIAKIMAVPAHLMRSARDVEDARRRAIAAAEPLQRQLARLTEVCSRPPAMILLPGPGGILV